MKATIIGSDYLQKDDSVKFLEINTNTTIYNEGADLLDYTALFNMLNDNGITEFHFIWTDTVAYKPLNQPFRFKEILQSKCLENNITYTEYVVPMNSVTVPYVEDATNRFILRQAFDTTALVDETYCADKFEFFNLMSGSSYVPKTYYSSDTLNLNTLDEVDYTTTTNPNLLIKYRYPQYDGMIYPSLYTISSNTELASVKETELESNYLAQEFIFSEENLVEGRYSIIRGIDIIYGPNLDIVNMGGYTQSTMIPISLYADEFVTDTKKLNQKSRYKYITKEVGRAQGNDYHTDDDSNILNYDGSLVNVSTIQLGDYMRSIDFVDSNENQAGNPNVAEMQTYGWDSTLQQSNDTLTQTSSSLQFVASSSVEMIMIKITLEDGKTWTDTPSCIYYIEEKDSTATRFEKVNSFYIGDKLVVTDATTNQLTTIAITGLEMVFEHKTLYLLDFEPSDLFLVDIGDGIFSVMHNACYGCSYSYCGSFVCSNYCPTCGGGGGYRLEKI